MSRQEDMLDSIFAMQAALNNDIFSRQQIRADDGDVLSMDRLHKAAEGGEHGVNALPNQWLCRYSQAMRAELAELDAELLYKWWSRDAIDIENVRVELVDILHFLVSAMISAGMSADDVYRIYQHKNAVNLKRQEDGYSRTSGASQNSL